MELSSIVKMKSKNYINKEHIVSNNDHIMMTVHGLIATGGTVAQNP